jgi:hypothetical protein
MHKCVMPDDVLFRTKTGNVYHFSVSCWGRHGLFGAVDYYIDDSGIF